jgi:hypothetical protein
MKTLVFSWIEILKVDSVGKRIWKTDMLPPVASIDISYIPSQPGFFELREHATDFEPLMYFIGWNYIESPKVGQREI